MKFSQKIGQSPIREAIQIASMDTKLKTKLWNVLYLRLDDMNKAFFGDQRINKICMLIWTEFFDKRADKIPLWGENVNVLEFITFIENWYFNTATWYEKYDFIEFYIKIHTDFLGQSEFVFDCNDVLQKELSGYRIVGGYIAQISSDEEIVEIEDALRNSCKWTPVNSHLKKSIELFSNRETPDYRNSMKESISAVESLCCIITKEKKTTLAKALAKVEKKFPIHPALKKTFIALYGYTNDASGIRHALSEGDKALSFDDAKFMLVTCAAFVNYLKAKCEE